MQNFFGFGSGVEKSISAHLWCKLQTKWVCPSGTQRICKNDSDWSLESLTVTRVESFCEKRDSNRVTVFLNVTRIESPFFST